MVRLATVERSFPTFTAPFRWARRSRRRLVTASLVTLALLLTPPIWWATQLAGLPEIGEPFDQNAFRALSIPDERNAYRIYEQAWARVRSIDTFFKPAGSARLDWTGSWTSATPEVRLWAQANGEALALYRRASDMSDAEPEPPRFEGWHQEIAHMATQVWLFQSLALLEGSRLETSGDMPGAWGWYRANLRTIHLVGLRATVFRRSLAQDWHRALNERVAGWAANPRTSPSQIRQALDDVLACGALVPSESYTLRAEYLDVDRLLDDPEGMLHMPQRSSLALSLPFGVDYQLSPQQALALQDAWRFILGEPERSRRVLRQAFANWLAHYDLPPEARPQPDLGADGVVDFFYPLPATARAKAGALPPQELARWLRTAVDANVLLGFWGVTAVRRGEKTNHRDLVIMLATELYRRDHGSDPPSLGALVGPYVKSLPPEFREMRDESAPEFGITRE
jgi:hypothetical protein